MSGAVKCLVVSFDGVELGRRLIGVACDKLGADALILRHFMKHNVPGTPVKMGDPMVSVEDGVTTTTYPIVRNNEEEDTEDCYICQETWLFP